MENINFLITFLNENDTEYWIVSKTNYDKSNSILFIVTPSEILSQYSDADNLPLSKIRYFYNMEITHNIFLSTIFPPFQRGQTLGSFNSGFPIKDCNDFSNFWMECITSRCNDLYFYKKILEKYTEKR
jgi:hypothetical protein